MRSRKASKACLCSRTRRAASCSSWASTACFKARIKACSVIANLLLLAAHILETIVIHEHEHITVLHDLHDLPFRFFGLYRFRRAGVSLRLYVHLRRRRASASSLSGFMAQAPHASRPSRLGVIPSDLAGAIPADLACRHYKPHIGRVPANLDPLNGLRLGRLGAEQLRKGGAGHSPPPPG